ncbi:MULTISPECIES: hypothetical protein [unclassified Rhodococcus (in: high G+C Gram-positive bacteria)]|jgi:hypothetical protein|uniref:hypothetical protein n=1 Tax=unclassified Rhodococcus (in: high G+C Gram-positive bacteria) TaxID=192944 RepID=UPI00146AF1ED|nr:MULTISPECIES: hypothetical protein [unclassified Rhodococcus (in: high G+C Gram-positive bacteria)]MBF0663305.1 hypothetical protein [Rhodococcus sp. (in: high G+C Gram-positive bacteria)]NMD95373.1 hypothetical protein [Rhodococcus sp. BL-253-APC-6A1W]NME79759.1 hypothetical protein [Rhodococcus sp. 105337]
MALRGRQWWKLLGLAGVVGVAATGAVTLRAERKRRSYTPDEVRSRLHERYARAVAQQDGRGDLPLTQVPAGAPARIRRVLRRIRDRG